MAKVYKSYLLASFIVTVLQIEVNDAQSIPGVHPPPEDALLNFTGLAAKYGHQAIQYEVITEDEYILTLYRFRGRSKYPLLIMHGFLDTSDTWLLRGKESLGIFLANEGYDVWFGNSRGNRYSRGHVSLDADTDASYWDWSFHELGCYDLPAIIDTVLTETGAPSLSAIGYSRGNSIFYVLGSTRPEYNSKINLMIALAPVGYLTNVQPPAEAIPVGFSVFYNFLRMFNIEIKEVAGYNGMFNKILRAFCTFPFIGPAVCLNTFFTQVGFDQEEIELSFVNVIIYHFPAGTSAMDLLHFAQLYFRGEFAQFDYGTARNLEVYQSPEPPVYDLSQVTMPIAMFVGLNDRLTPLPDVTLLKKQLPNVVEYKINRRLLLNHIDPLWGRRMRDYLFPDLCGVLSQYNEV